MAERLPVNPRRRKVAPENRKRVAKACNGCNVRRIKCSGDRPCQQCRSASRDCLYPAVEVSKDTLQKNEIERLRKRCATLERGLQALLPDENARQELLLRLENDSTPPESPLANLQLDTSSLEATEATEATEGRLLFDPDGNVRFLGETSGATFLNFLKEFMLTLVPLTFGLEPGNTSPDDGSIFVASIGRYQTFDSRPLQDPDVDPLWLPTRTEMTLMLAEFRYHVQDGNGDFPSGGVYFWGCLGAVPTVDTLLLSNTDAIDSDNYRYLAFYHVTFALASQFTNQIPLQGEEEDAYFKRARMLLGNPLDTVRFTIRDVPVLALMGFYLIERNRRDFAYMYVSLAIHIAITHGAFRHCVDEAPKRIFWTLYILDRWLSCLMGRPPTLLDEAIRLPLPADAPTLPPAAGLLAHVQLARISGYIVRETHKIAPREPKSRNLTGDIEKALGLLEEWLPQLPPSLQMPSNQFSLDPACCTLHMAYHQLVLLVTRPVFFTAAKRAVAEKYINNGNWRLENHPQFKHIQACSTAAHYNICLAQWLVQLYNSRRLLQAGLHFVFNAAVILLLNRVLRAYSGSTDADINWAIQLFAEEAQIGNDYPRDCFQVLKDLKTIIDRFLSPQPQSSQPNFGIGQVELSSSALNESEQMRNLHNAHGTQSYTNEANDAYQELITWMQNDDSQQYTGLEL